MSIVRGRPRIAFSQAGSHAYPMLASKTGATSRTSSAHSNPAFVASRHARSRASMPNARAGLLPTGTNRRAGSDIAAAHNGRWRGREGLRPLHLLLPFISRTNPPRMADLNQHDDDQPHGSVYRVAGALTITRAATTQREVD